MQTVKLNEFLWTLAALRLKSGYNTSAFLSTNDLNISANYLASAEVQTIKRELRPDFDATLVSLNHDW